MAGMKREELKAYIEETYGVKPDYPWAQFPNYMVFRHQGSRKWFAVAMDVPPEKFGLPEGPALDVVNVKCGPVAAGSFRKMPGVYPAYHLNKGHWLSVALKGGIDGETLRLLLDISFHLTAAKPRGRKAPPPGGG